MDESVDAETGPRARRSRRRLFDARGSIFALGAFAGLAIVLASAVVLDPLIHARTNLREIAHDGVPLQSQLVEFRTTAAEWQSFIERQVDSLEPGVVPAATDLVAGGQLVNAQAAQAKAMSRDLRRVGFTTDADKLDAAMSAFTKTLAKLAPAASGNPVSAAALQSLVDAERTTHESVWGLTTQIGHHLSQGLTQRENTDATDHVALVLWFFLIGVGIALIVVWAAAVSFGLRAGHRARERQQVNRRHAYETRLQEALEMTKTEPDVYAILGEALHEAVPRLKVELLIADSSRAHFHRALTNGEDFEGCSVVSPLDCPAATVGHTLIFPSSGALNACPYLKDRPSGACSAACHPTSIAGRTVGVSHAVAADGIPPTEHDLELLSFTSRRGSERIAMIRAFATSETQAQTDPLTGLLNRRSLENAVRDLRREGVQYALAYGDLDHFKVLNDTHGHEAGDQALRLFARVLGDSLRPNDLAARYGGEEFVVVLPECGTLAASRILERVRESLALAVAAGRVPPFTVTFGVASTEYAAEFDEIVAIADRTLYQAKAAGRNRVSVAELPAPDQPLVALT
jgi:diguanylate cyclase (GGDEF)-like protein